MPARTLTIDTTTALCSAAIHQKDILLATIEHHISRAHNEHLPAMVDYLLGTTNTLSKELMGVAISKGPGSYTGLRIAAAFAKGFCFAHQIPLVALNSLQVLQEEVRNYPLPENAICYALLDARRGSAYVLAQGISKSETLIAEKNVIWNIDMLPMHLAQDNKIFFIGNAADIHKTTLSQYGIIIPQCYPRASNMGRIAYEKLIQNDQEDLASFSPDYISAWV